jgi:hypothetical protein
MPKENNHAYEDCEPSPLFRDFAAECIELAQTALHLRGARYILKTALSGSFSDNLPEFGTRH